MKKLALIIGIVFGFLANDSIAQTMASDLVKKTVDNLNKHKNVEFVFDYEVGNQTIAVSEKASGKVILQGEAYKMDIEGQQIISDGTSIWTYLIDSEEVMISDAGNDESIITPIKLLTSYDKDYAMKYVASSEKGIKVVEMSNPKGEFSKVTLKIDDKKMEIVSAVIQNRGGDEFNISIQKTTYDQALGDKFFTFNAKEHPKAEVIDMR